MGETSLIAACIKARQIGFSHATAGDAVKEALTQHSTNIILSASQELSDEVLLKAKGHARVLAKLGYPDATPSAESSTRIVFPNGGRVIALPANPRTARSFTGNVYFDEAAYHNDFQAIWDAAGAMAIRRNFKIRVISTPNGATGLFHDWATNPPKGWAVHEVTVDQAINEGMRVKIERLWELAGGDERIFAQWFRCQFLDGNLQYVPTAMADRALNWPGETPANLLAHGEIHAGLDVGRENDLTVLAVVVKLGRWAYVLPPITCKRTKFRAQRDMIRTAREAFGWDTLHVDATGLGMDMAEELVTQYGEDEVIPLQFTNPAKEDLATRAMRWFRDDRVRFPRGSEGKQLHRETCAVRRKVTESGNIVYEVPRTRDGHGDRWWSLCLALKGAGEPQSPRGMGQEPLLMVA
jgi:phage FluMu gp28-like protein